MVLPQETRTPAGEATFGRKLMILTIIWIVLTILVGVFLVLIAPWMSGLF